MTLITYGKNFVVTTYSKRNLQNNGKTYVGYVNVKAKNKNIKINTIRLKQGYNGKGFKYKTYKVNSNKKTIKLGKNIFVAGYGSVYKIKYSQIKTASKNKISLAKAKVIAKNYLKKNKMNGWVISDYYKDSKYWHITVSKKGYMDVDIGVNRVTGKAYLFGQ